MENSLRRSKSTLNESSEDVKVFVKLSSKEESSMLKRVFFFEENREVLLLQKGFESLLKYKYDYIFSDYENTLLISSSIKSTVANLIKNEKNLCFFTFGEEKLGKTKFLLGSNYKVNKDSFFKYTIDSIINILSKEVQFDNILIDIFKVSNEKFVLDYRNVAHDMRYDILEVINQIIKDGMRNSISNTNNSAELTHSLDNGHLIISLKFFKFVTDADVYKEQREVEIIRTISFIDIEGFNSSFTQLLLKNQTVTMSTNPKNYTLLHFKNLIESIAVQDLEKYSEVNSILASLITEIMRIQNTTFFFFGFIDQNDNSILESTVTLEIMNKFKIINTDYFFDVVQDMNIDIGNEDNNLKEEYHIIDHILSELIFYIEKAGSKNTSNICFNESFYNNIKDLTQMEKFNFLKDFLNDINFNLDSNPQIKKIFECVLTFFQNRSKWKNLYMARDEIIALNTNYKETEPAIVYTSVNETDELKSVLRNLSKVVKNVEENENNSIFEKLSENNNAITNMNVNAIQMKLTNEKMEEQISKRTHQVGVFNSNQPGNIQKTGSDTISNNIYNPSNPKVLSDSKSKTSNNLKTTVDMTGRTQSIETAFMQMVLKDFIKNMGKAEKNLYAKFTEDEKCISCQKGSGLTEPVSFKVNTHHFQIMKASAMHKKEKDMGGNLSLKSNYIENGNLKTTNIRSNNMTKVDENYKNQETNFKFHNQVSNSKKSENDNIRNSNNNILVNKNIISDILTSNQVSVNILNRYSRSNRSSSQSIQIFKMNGDKVNENHFNQVIEINKNKSDHKFISGMSISSKSSHHQKNKSESNIDNKNGNSKSIHSSSININLSERISKIENKLYNLNTKVNNSQLFNNSSSDNVNLDSRVKSLNDVSQYEESKILKNKSFLSYNN